MDQVFLPALCMLKGVEITIAVAIRFSKRKEEEYKIDHDVI